MEQGTLFYLLLLGVTLSVHALPQARLEVNEPPQEMPSMAEEEDIMSFADLDDALLDSFNGTGSYGYELEDILEELKHSNSTVALNEIMGAVEDKERVARAVCYSTSAYGGNGGGAFADPCVAGIEEVRICYGCCSPRRWIYVVQSIQVKYRHPDGYSFWAPRHGGNCQYQRRMTLGTSDKIIAVVMLASTTRVHSLAFLVQRPYGVRLYGTWGDRYYGRLEIIRRNNIVSFYGRSGADLGSLGFFYRN